MTVATGGRVRTWSPGRPRSTWVPRSARCAAGGGDPTFRYDGTARRGGGLWRTTRDAGRSGDPAARGAPGRRRGRRHRVGARRRAGSLDGLPALLGASTTSTTRRRRPRRAPPGRCATRGADPPRLAGAAHRPGAGGAGPRGAGAEGHRPRGVDRPGGRSSGGTASRAPGPVEVLPPDALHVAPDARTWARGCRPGTGTAPASTCPGRGPLVTAAGRAGRLEALVDRPPADGRDGPADAARASASGPRPRSASAPSATPTPCRSATSTSRRWSAGRWSASRSTTTRCSSCSSPTAGTATGCSGWSSCPGIAPRAPRPALRRPRLPHHVDHRPGLADNEVSGAGGSRRGRAAGGPAPGSRRGRRRRHPSGPSRRAGRARARTTSRQNIVLLTHAEPSPSTASATSRFSHARRPSRRGTSRAPPSSAARRGSRASRRATRHGTTRVGTPRSTSPRRVRRATCSSVKPSRRRSATQAASIASSSRSRTLRVVDDDEPPRRRVVRRRCGDRGGDGPSYRVGVDRLVGEGAHGAPGRRRPRGSRAGTCPRAAGRTSAAAPGPSSRSGAVREPADDGERPAAELALHQVGGRRDLVGDRGDRGGRGRCRARRRGRAGRRAARARRRRSPGRSGPCATAGPSCR